MAHPIEPLPELQGKEAEEFVKEAENPIPTIAQREFIERFKKYREESSIEMR